MHELKRRSPARWRDDSGAQMVEFLLIAVFVLIPLFGGIINFGYLYGQKLGLNQAVRAGARAAVVNGNGSADTQAKVLTLVRNAAGGSLLNESLIQLDNPVDSGNVTTCTDPGLGQNLQVKVAYNTDGIFPLLPGFGPYRLTAQSVFRCEW